MLFDGDAEAAFHVFSRAFAGLDALVCYAMKANSNQAVLKTARQARRRLDVVSEGELRRALAAGIVRRTIMFSGVGKTAREMDFALDAGIHCFNVESEPELELLSARAAAAGKHRARLAPHQSGRRRQDPPKISTGKEENKFGIPRQRARAVYRHAATLPGIKVTGIDMHIGSQITDLQPFDDAFELLPNWSRRCAPTATRSSTSMSAAGSAFPTSMDNNPPPLPDAYAANRQEAPRASSAARSSSSRAG